MNITLLTYGSRGDVQPFMALAVGLIKAGHTPLLVAPGRFASLASQYKVDFLGLPGDPAEISLRLNDAGANPLKMISAVRDYVMDIAPQVIRQTRIALQNADLVVHSFLFTTGGHSLARELGIPDISVQTFPMFAPTSSFPNVAVSWIPPGIFSRLSHLLATQTFWYGGNSGLKNIRKQMEVAEIPEMHWPFRRLGGRPLTPLVIACSPAVLPAVPEWNREHIHLPGYFFLEDDGWKPPQGLLQFLQSGLPPICITFGSNISRQEDLIRAAVLGALEKTGQRGLILTGWGGDYGQEFSEEIFVMPAAPHSWVLPKCSLVVHHGGAGSTAAGLRTGIPNIVVPSTSDQFFWGKRVFELGAGPRPIRDKKLSINSLSEAIEQSLQDQKIQKSSRELGEKIRAEDGVARMVSLVEQHFASWQHGG